VAKTSFKSLNYAMIKVEHIGIAVKKLSVSVPLFEAILNSSCYKTEDVESEKVRTAFFQNGETKVELLEDFEDNGVISRFIEKKGEGIHHIAFAVKNIEQEMQRLQQQGFTLLNEKAKKGADNKLVCFLHPKSTNGVLIELCQEIE
jgi:methylmalonyl-CoA/ethylmalonyl-CoA epimerase